MGGLVSAASGWDELAALNAAPKHDQVYRTHRGKPKGLVLLAHPGGFLLGSSSQQDKLARTYVRAGYNVRSLAYPLNDYRGAVRYSRKAALAARRRGRKVFAVGESAGGTLATDLALRGIVNGAVAVGAPTDFRRWYPKQLPGMTREKYREQIKMSNPAKASPITRARSPRRSDLLLFHSTQDETVDFGQSERFAHRSGAMLRELRGPHLADTSWVQRSRRFMDAR